MDRLRAMELFLSISRTQSFSETARLFGVSATSVSRMITEFENELNVKLLLRSTRQVVLNEAGQEYARQLEGILWSINEAHNNITAIRAAPKGTLRVHSRMMFGLGVLPPLIAEFRTQYPDIHIELLLAETKADLRRQQIDIDFRIAPPVEAGLKRRILFKSERHLVASPAYVASMPPLTEPRQVAEHHCLPYLLPGDNYVWRFMTPDGVEEVAIKPRHVSNTGMALLELARLGEGIALLDDYTIANDVARGTLVRLLPEFRVTNTTFEEGIYATILDTPMIPAKIRLFLDFVASRVSGKDQRFQAYRKPAN
ncbi:LysR family transcriptional regulator [Achromobacter sp. GG226]|uniref:LysR family transcriptional regulator n=1 Tax=Verticiella alkaliphila TaxID=2779529 RepID=UPI001C0E6436|nr:LysR family transcriptional regulator [Verticiella sp. GG226]MBU4609395.1 LysR family transcriptional regulator [Verticiella sp. GG226]